MATKRPCIVYGLRRADDRQVRYIGQTHQPLEQRLIRHLSDARKESNKYHRAVWVRKAMADNVQVEIVPLIENAKWDSDEKRLIAQYKKAGVDLVNGTKGGKGRASWRVSPEFREKRRLAMLGNTTRKGKRVSAQGRKNISEGHKKHYAKNGHHCTGKPLPQAVKDKLSKILTGRVFTPQHLANMKKPKSAEHKRRLSEAASLRWAKERGELPHGN